ncbi:MAG: extracellular solute-binding protein [Clostridia bacterium]|nr:extracellular solute-binding protein [Clostridia bacterium]
MKKNFLKAVALGAVAAISVTMFAGCGGTGTSEAPRDEQGRVIISVGGWPDKEGPSLDNINARKAGFEAANTDVVVEPDLWKFDRKTFYAKAAGGQLPTVFNVGYTEMPEIINSEYSADLTDVLSKRGYDGMFNENIMNTIADEDGRIFAFPTSSYILGLNVHIDLFKEAGLLAEDGTPRQPKDWNELAEMAKIIKEKTGKAGFVFPTANKVGGWIFTCLAWSFGVDFMEKGEDGKWQAKFDSPECVEALQFIKDLKWEHDVLPANTLIDYNEMYKVFSTGGAGMLIAAGDSPNYVYSFGMKPDQLGMVALPAGPKRHVTLLGGGTNCVKAGATEEEIDASIRWIETSYNYQLTEEYKANTIKSIDQQLAEGRLVGIKSMSPWSSNAESLNWHYQLIDEKANSNPNHVKLYNDFVLNCPAEVQPEEPVCCQELYETLDGCLQEVLTNKDADCAKLIEGAVADFQANSLDNLTY